MKRHFLLAALTCAVMALTAGTAAASTPQPFFQGFESDTSGWATPPTRVASDTNGIPSSEGSFHAEADSGDFTRFGGYTDTFPAGGWATAIDIYLDQDFALANRDKRFDWDVASNRSNGAHLRDFVFNGGTTPASYTGTHGFVINASTSAGRGSSFPSNTCPSPGPASAPAGANICRTPVVITTEGWYTFVHRFYANTSNNLAVDMTILDSSGNVVKTWTINTNDPMSIVGGNRYGFVAQDELGVLAIDNSGLYTSSRDAKQGVRDDLAEAAATATGKDQDRMEDAIEHIDRSLNADLWNGDVPAAKHGNKVFDEEKKAVEQLERVAAPDVSGAIAALVNIDRLLAQGTIDQAVAANGDAKEIAKANAEMDRAAEDLADGDEAHAIDRYKKAWEHAQHALKNA